MFLTVTVRFFSWLSPGVFEPVQFANDKFSSPNTCDCSDHDTDAFFCFTSHLLMQYCWLLFLLLPGPSVFYYLPGLSSLKVVCKAVLFFPTLCFG